MNPFDKEDVLDILLQSDVRLTAEQFNKKIAARFSISLRAAKKIVTTLINDQELCYHDMFGSTYIEKSFLRPVKITDHFLLKPPFFHVDEQPGLKAISIESGISFGSGQHPTTRLCLKAIDRVMFEKKYVTGFSHLECADIGTGSGVLAIAMIKSGMDHCKAYEIDPVSVNEARKNLSINRMEDRIELIDGYFKETRENLAMICANLRYPTLKQLSGPISNSLGKKGIAVLSGIREWEKEDLISTFEKKNMMCQWQRDEKKWSAVILIKK